MRLNADVTGYSITEDGLTIINPRGRSLIQRINNRGYRVFSVAEKDTGDKQIAVLVHRMVALTFIANPDNKRGVSHIDGDKLNNCVDNLEWSYYLEGRNPPRRHKGQTVSPVRGTHVKTGKVIYLATITGNKAFDGSAISNCCSGKRKTHRGYVWERT